MSSFSEFVPWPYYCDMEDPPDRPTVARKDRNLGRRSSENRPENTEREREKERRKSDGERERGSEGDTMPIEMAPDGRTDGQRITVRGHNLGRTKIALFESYVQRTRTLGAELDFLNCLCAHLPPG